MAQFGRAGRLGRSDREFKSLRPDLYIYNNIIEGIPMTAFGSAGQFTFPGKLASEEEHLGYTSARCCPPCDVKWIRSSSGDDENCFVCDSPGRPGELREYCLHGVRKTDYVSMKKNICDKGCF